MTRAEFLKIPGVKVRLDELATKHGFTVDQILTVIQKESNFKTTAENSKSKATGLIQFMPDTATGLGTSIEQIAEMDAVAQLDLVDRYFEQNHTKGQHPYITVAYPAAANMDMDDIIADSTSTIAAQNPVWQDKDGNVTKKSILAYVGEKPSEKSEEQKKQIPTTQTVLGPDGEMIEIEVGADVTEADLAKSIEGEQKYKSWDDFQENASTFDKSQPFTIGEGAFEKRYKWDEDSEKALLIDKDGNYLPKEAQTADQKLQESFRGDQVVEKGIVTDEGTTPKEKAEELIIDPPLIEKEKKKGKYIPLDKGFYQDDEGNIWRKGDEGGWQVKYNTAAKGVPQVDEFGDPSFEMEFKYDKEWSTLSKDDKFDEPWTNTEQFESQLTPYSQGVYKGEVSDLPTTTIEEEAPLTRGEQLMKGGTSLVKGAQAALDYIGGPGAIISYIMGKKGLKAAMKEIQPQKRAELSPMFMQHLRQSRELAKKGFHPDQARKARKEIDKAYQIGLENSVRGSGGDRAKFLARSGVLDAQRSSALLNYAVEDEKLQLKNADKYEKLMLFKENFDLQRTEQDRAEDMERQIADKKAAAGFTSAAFTNLISGFGGSSLTNQYSGTSQLYSQLQNMFTKPTGTNE